MSKSSFLNNKKLDKSSIALICIFGMIAGFLVSRVALSISTFLFGLNAIRDINPRQWLKQKWWLIGLAWVALYAISYFWTTDKGNWGTRLEVKLPVLLLPLAFSFLPPFSRRQAQLFTVSVALMLVASAVYSVSFLVIDPAHYIHGYLQSHVLPTLPRYDHIRASMAIVLFIIWSICIWPMLCSRSAKWITGISIGVLILFIHILAAKSGLVSFYIFIICWGTYITFVKKNILGFVLIAAIPLLIFLGIRYIPTFRERANYIDFTWYMYTHGDTSGQYGDIARIMSYKLALDIIKEHPLIGVGTGDMLVEMNKSYDRYYPAAPDTARLLPHNQFLVVALGCGLPAMLLFAIWVFMPLGAVRKNRNGFFFFTVWFILFIQLMIEPVLEIQFGVFVYLFFLLMQKHELQAATSPGSSPQGVLAQA